MCVILESMLVSARCH